MALQVSDWQVKGLRPSRDLVGGGRGHLVGQGPLANTLQAEGGGEQDDWCLKLEMTDWSLCILVLRCFMMRCGDMIRYRWRYDQIYVEI